MSDRFLIATKTKKTIEFIEQSVVNFSNKENALKQKLLNECYELLELVYLTNISKTLENMKLICVKIKMIDYLLKRSFQKRLISIKKYECAGNYLLELNKMVNA